MSLRMKTIRAKYQIKPGISVNCYLEVEDLDEKSFRAYVGIKRKGDTVVPVGTTLILNPGQFLSKPDGLNTGIFEEISVKVLAHQVYRGDIDTVHICTPVKHRKVSERRVEVRKKANFELGLAASQGPLSFSVVDGHEKGLGLVFRSQKPITSVNHGIRYNFIAEHKGLVLTYPGTVRHILYNWKTYEHQVGVELFPIEEENKLLILRILLDPGYSIDLGRTAVDTGEGRVGRF